MRTFVKWPNKAHTYKARHQPSGKKRTNVNYFIKLIGNYSRTPLIRPPSESHWCGRIRGMVAREGFVYEQKPLSVTQNVVVWEGWSLVRVVVRQGFYCSTWISGHCESLTSPLTVSLSQYQAYEQCWSFHNACLSSNTVLFPDLFIPRHLRSWSTLCFLSLV